MNDIIHRDTEDARRQLNAEALAESAKEIHTRHQALEGSVEDLRGGMMAALSERVQIAKIVEVAASSLGPRRFFEWWSEQKLPVGWSKRYLTIAKTSSRGLLCSKDQLRLTGLIDDAEGHNEGQQREKTGLEWLKHAGKVASSFRTEDVARMPQADVSVALKKLAPLKELIAALEQRAAG